MQPVPLLGPIVDLRMPNAIFREGKKEALA